jgi:uncharacterized protein YndB with AHSA1/START domain
MTTSASIPPTALRNPCFGTAAVPGSAAARIASALPVARTCVVLAAALIALASPSGSRAADAAAANAAVTAPAPKLPDGVTDSSFTLPSGERVLQLSAVVDGPPALAWRAFTTPDGFSAWAVAAARVDLRVGGEIESSYDASVPLGSGRTIRNQILAFVPERVLAIRNVQTPPNAPFDGPTFQELQTVVLFEAADATHTRITLVNGGYRTGERYDNVLKHFRAGNAYTLAVLGKHLAKLAGSAAAGAGAPPKP